MLARRKGQSLLEYVFLMSAVVAGIILAYNAVRSATNNSIVNTADAIERATSNL